MSGNTSETNTMTRFICWILIWFSLFTASLSVAFEPASIMILFLCTVALILWIFNICSWPGSLRRHSPPRTHVYIWVFVLFYLCFTYLFSLVYYAIAQSGRQIFEKISPENTSFIDSFYFSITTATTLGYCDLSPADSLIKCLSILEVSFGPIFIAAILAVALTFHQPSDSGKSRQRKN
jgi:hypothetical protein